MDELEVQINLYLKEKLNNIKNVHLIETKEIFKTLGIDRCINYRQWYTAKVLFTVEWFDALASEVLIRLKPLVGRTKKVLVLDCDNTLWGGIVAEDLIDNLDLSESSPKGRVFEEIQRVIKNLASRGVIICICSKNNKEDVCEVFQQKKEMILKLEDFTIAKINWEEKSKNLKEISEHLNISLDQFAFVDDSSYEVDLIRSNLPMVEVFQVPSNIYKYVPEFMGFTNCFYTESVTLEDINRSKYYAQDIERNAEKSAYLHHDDYLRSLKIKISVKFWLILGEAILIIIVLKL